MHRCTKVPPPRTTARRKNKKSLPPTRIMRLVCVAIGCIWTSNFMLVTYMVEPPLFVPGQHDSLLDVRNSNTILRRGSSRLRSWSPLSSSSSSSSTASSSTSNDKHSHQKRRRTPVVIVPGSMGSILQARIEKKKVSAGFFCSSSWNSWYNLWLSEWALVFSSCFFGNIKMHYLGTWYSPKQALNADHPSFSLHVTSHSHRLPYKLTIL